MSAKSRHFISELWFNWQSTASVAQYWTIHKHVLCKHSSQEQTTEEASKVKPPHHFLSLIAANLILLMSGPEVWFTVPMFQVISPLSDHQIWHWTSTWRTVCFKASDQGLNKFTACNRTSPDTSESYSLRLNKWKEKQKKKHHNNKKREQSKLTEVSFDNEYKLRYLCDREGELVVTSTFFWWRFFCLFVLQNILPCLLLQEKPFQDSCVKLHLESGRLCPCSQANKILFMGWSCKYLLLNIWVNVQLV